MNSLCKTVILACVCAIASAHLSLTFPPARNPPRDFLDEVRTPSPCGVPKPDDDGSSPLLRSYVAGSTMNITWRMAYPHVGGYKIRLFDSNGDIVANLTDGDEWVGQEDQSSESARVTLPDEECIGCFIQMIRQGHEWGDAYNFHSCADIDIVMPTSPLGEQLLAEPCRNGGTTENDVCSCPTSFTGPLCQYKSDCATNGDCLNDGMCMRQVDSIPRRVCFCQYGFFGVRCEKESPRDTAQCYESYVNDDDASCYDEIPLRSWAKFLYRVDGDVLETVVEMDSSSWIGIGVRPEHFNKSCVNLGTKQQQHADEDGHAHAEPDSASESEPHGDNEQAYGDSTPEPEPSAEQVTHAGEEEQLHPMDCQDMIVGYFQALHSLQRVGDYYTLDRSTPLLDEEWGGDSSLLAAFMRSTDGRMSMMTRRKIQSTHFTDNSVDEGAVMLVYARGQREGAYIHSPHSAAESTSNFSNTAFYTPGVLKYHGHGLEQRDAKRNVILAPVRTGFAAEQTGDEGVMDGAAGVEASTLLSLLTIPLVYVVLVG